MLDSSKYDVAISFMNADANTARAFSSKLAEVFDVFLYFDRQDVLAGTEGMATMRKPFFEDSRLMVVLYREGWGTTDWTAIEERAIKDACFKGEWNRLFFIALNGSKTFPDWLPLTHVRYNFTEFGIEGAIGAIKARVLENKGQIKPMTAVKRSEILAEEDNYRNAKRSSLSPNKEASIKANFSELLTEIIKQCQEVDANGLLSIGYGVFDREPRECVATNGEVSILVYWQAERTLTEVGYVVIREFNSRLSLPTDPNQIRILQNNRPHQVAERRFKPDLSRSYELGWLDPENDEFISSQMLATKCVVALLDLIEKRNSGQLPRSKGIRTL